MMKFSRRIFLQSVGLSVTSLGTWGSNLFISKSQLNAYGEILESSTSQKLALLVGINQYSQGKSLKGCTTDVELQKDLLIYRFGFEPNNIVTLTDHQATRENILTVFEEHLLKQVQNNDVVVFHFSGYGRQVKLNNNEDNFSLVNSLITHDNIPSQDNVVNDILVDNIINLAQSFKTNKYTLIFDTNFVPSSLPLANKLSLRCQDFNDNLVISEAELNLSQKLVNNTSQILGKNKSNQLSGLILSPVVDSISTEINSFNFNVGLFTYALTESLWQIFPETDNLTLMKKVASEVTLFSGNNEKLAFKPNTKIDIFSYHLPTEYSSQGNAIITNIIEPNLVELKLIGLPLFVLFNYQLNSCFVTNIDNQKMLTLQIIALEGNKAKAVIINNDEKLVINKGVILKEFVRVIKKNTKLNIALNHTLEKIEKVDATSALSAIDTIESVINFGDNFADIIFSKLTNLSNVIDGYSLFSSSGILLTNTFPKVSHEAVSSAVKRLIPSLKIALAEKLFHLTLNQYSSLLPVSVSLEISHNNKKFITKKQTINSYLNSVKDSKIKSSFVDNNLLINIPLGSRFTINIDNENDYDLYYLLLGINSSRQIIAYFSPNSGIINQGKTVSIAENSDSLKLIVNNEKNLGEFILICAKSPFNKTLNKLYKTTDMKLDIEQIIVVENPVIIAQCILEDLHLGSNINPNLVNNVTDIYTLALSNWATFSFVYQIE
ncbi:caspase family protein [Geminocystis sp.]|uniref:caspase family protein n=1 Tax=Geminocystis sp. TaxID=2664100 RepID=UPI0035936F8C